MNWDHLGKTTLFGLTIDNQQGRNNRMFTKYCMCCILDGGFYMYAEASHIPPNCVAWLLSGLIIPSRIQCLTFWYHMYGENINTLSVYQGVDTTLTKIWTTYGDKGKKWNYQILNLKQDIGQYKIAFQASRGYGSKGDIALDDIVIANRQCYGKN
jgi:hypothetical protein